MKRKLLYIQILFLAIVVLLPVITIAQEKVETKVRVKTVKQMDGKIIEKDTVFIIADGDLKEDIIKKYTWTEDSDNIAEIFVDIDTDIDGEEHKIIYMNDAEIDERDMDALKVELEALRDHIKDIEIDIDGDKIMIIEEIQEPERLREIDELNDINEFNNLVFSVPEIPEVPDFVHYDGNYFFADNDGRVSEKEIRDAGLKSKPNKLLVDNLNIDIDGGLVKINFETPDKINPKIIVFNYFGEKVYSGKPSYENGNYSDAINLINKQKGTYYLQIIYKDSSITRKLQIR